MSKSFESYIRSLSVELEQLRSRACPDGFWNEDPALNRQLNFWGESARFCISELEIWDQQGNDQKCLETVGRARKCLANLHKLVD